MVTWMSLAMCFLLVDMDGNVQIQKGGEACTEQVSPCSTFKIPNAMLALESGNADAGLKKAIRESDLKYFQDIARRVGRQDMKAYVERIGYGNRDVSGKIDWFWVESTLEISPAEQVEFLRQMYRGKLPVKQDAVDTVKEMIVQESGVDWAFSGKTGTCLLGDKRMRGWFVGHVRNGGKERVFTMMMEGDGVRGADAKKATRRALEAAKLIPHELAPQRNRGR